MPLTRPREKSTEKKSPKTRFQLSFVFLNNMTDLKRVCTMNHFFTLSKLNTLIIGYYFKTQHKMKNTRKKMTIGTENNGKLK